MFKRCGRCRRELPVGQFSRAGAGRQHWCRACYRAYFKARGDLHRRQAGRAKRARQEAARRWILRYLLSHPCERCGEPDMVVLEFHHLGQKRASLAHLVMDGKSPARLADEAARCQVLCANCHRRETAMAGRWWRLDPAILDGRRLWPRQRRNLRYIWMLLSQRGCIDCDESDAVVLEFDHVDTKRSTVTRMAHGGYSLRAIQAEIRRCEVRCVNCHRRRTAERGGHFRHHGIAPVAQSG